MEMREMMDKILEMREMRETFKNAGDILEMRESPAQCGRVDSYAYVNLMYLTTILILPVDSSRRSLSINFIIIR